MLKIPLFLIFITATIFCTMSWWFIDVSLMFHYLFFFLFCIFKKVILPTAVEKDVLDLIQESHQNRASGEVSKRLTSKKLTVSWIVTNRADIVYTLCQHSQIYFVNTLTKSALRLCNSDKNINRWNKKHIFESACDFHIQRYGVDSITVHFYWSFTLWVQLNKKHLINCLNLESSDLLFFH